ncbi:MAG: ABC-F family ATP-binding cassette domain-containing protein [Myxococcota bacterium]|nr:ABC-F family ATP-binding cassette domain-containing protein [Myxococcota bacterium]
MITVTGLSKSYGSQVLFQDANLQLNTNNCYGIVGANGSGKSTLLRILNGRESMDEGEVKLPRNIRLGVLNQDHFQYEDTPILDVVMMGHTQLWSALKEQEKILSCADGDFDADRYAQLDDIILSFEGYSFEARAAEILAGLNIQTDKHQQPLSVLSGGYKLRVLLGQVLASNPDVLFLDEPTNHLDIISINWLEGFLKEYTGLAIVVSHDHRFLNTVCGYIIDVDYEAVTLYRGNYTRFTHLKVEDRKHREKEIDKRKKEIADHKAFITRFKAKATKARQANSRVKKIAKIKIEELATSSRRQPYFKLEMKRPSGKMVLKIKEIGKAYDQTPVLNNVSFTINRGEKVAIIGPNGIGKSTLLKIIMNTLQADTGSFEWGHETHVGYFAQDHKGQLGAPKQDILSSFWDKCPMEPIGFCYGKLAEVLFSREETGKKLENLSGGEAARLLMAKIAVQKPNVLVLDEPNNHLDLEGISALSRDLKAYEGTIVFVSHDRWLVASLATRIIEITPSGIDDYYGTYDEFMERRNLDHLDTNQTVAIDRAQKKKRKKK